jgi:hypothetical protein
MSQTILPQSSPFSQREYGQILQDLEDFASYLTSLGLRGAPNDRLRGLIADIATLEKARSEGGLPALEAQPAGLVWSLVEGQEFAEIFKGIAGYAPEVTKELMRKALKGPLRPEDETGSSNLARNTIFELLLGARFRGAGANPTLGSQADLLLNHFGSQVYIECKRPQRETSIEENIGKALGQLRNRIASDPRPDFTAGLVAVSISKAINPESRWLVVGEEADIERSLTREAERIHERCAGGYRRKGDTRLIGILYHILAPVLVKGNARLPLFAASQIDVWLDDDSMRKVFPVSGDELRKLFRRLRPVA